MSFWSECLEVINPYKEIDLDKYRKSVDTDVSDKKYNKKKNILSKKNKRRVKKKSY